MYQFKDLNLLKSYLQSHPLMILPQMREVDLGPPISDHWEIVIWKRMDAINSIQVQSTLSKSVLVISKRYLMHIDEDTYKMLAYQLQEAGIYKSFPLCWEDLLYEIINHLKTNKAYVHLNFKP